MAGRVQAIHRAGQGITLDEAIGRFRDHLQVEGSRPNTIRGYLADLQGFRNWLTEHWSANVNNDGLVVGQISRVDVRAYADWLAQQPIRPATYNRRVIALRRLFSFLAETGTIQVNVAEDLKPRDVQRQNTVKWLTTAEVGRVLHAIETQTYAGPHKRARDMAIFRLLIFCGPRVAELCDLRRDDVDLVHGIMTIRSGKGGKWRQVPVGDSTLSAMREYLSYRTDDHPALIVTERGTPISVRAVQHLCERYARLSGVELTPHVCRHTFAKRLLDNTGRLEYVATLLGHSSIDVTRIYTTPSMREMAAAVRQMDISGSLSATKDYRNDIAIDDNRRC